MTYNKTILDQFFGSLKPDCIFLGIKNYICSDGTVVSDTLAFHVSYENALKKAKKIVSSVEITDDLVIDQKFSKSDLELARIELLSSFNESLKRTKQDDDKYDHLYPGVKLLKKDNSLHLFGKRVARKLVKTSGITKKSSQRSNLTLAKEFLKEKTPLTKYQTYRLDKDSFKEITAGGKIITCDNLFCTITTQITPTIFVQNTHCYTGDPNDQIQATFTKQAESFEIKGFPGPTQKVYDSKEDAQKDIDDLCTKFNCPETDFSIQKL
jgi:hypothetical protein